MSSLEKWLFTSSDHFYFFSLILSCMNCLCIFWQFSPLSVASFANIFSHSEGCAFVLLMVSFGVQKLLKLIKSHLFMFVFISITLGDESRKILLRFMAKSVLPMFSKTCYFIFVFLHLLDVVFENSKEKLKLSLGVFYSPLCLIFLFSDCSFFYLIFKKIYLFLIGG